MELIFNFIGNFFNGAYNFLNTPLEQIGGVSLLQIWMFATIIRIVIDFLKRKGRKL